MAAMTTEHTANVHWAHKPQATQHNFYEQTIQSVTTNAIKVENAIL